MTSCQGRAEWKWSDLEWSGITPEWKGFDNKMGTVREPLRGDHP